MDRFCWRCQAYRPERRHFPCGHVGPPVRVLERRQRDSKEDMVDLTWIVPRLLEMDRRVGSDSLKHLGPEVPKEGIWCDHCVRGNHVLKSLADRFVGKESGGLVPLCHRHREDLRGLIPLHEGWRDYVAWDVMRG